MSKDKKNPLTTIHLRILDLLREHPEGLDIEQIRELAEIEGQQHLDKRVRELYPHFEIATKREGRRFIYQFVRERSSDDYDYSVISKTIRQIGGSGCVSYATSDSI